VILRPLHHGHLRPTDAARLLADAEAAELTYDHIGSTLDPDSWPGRRPHSETRLLGSGREAFELAATRLREWACQRHLGADLVPERPAASVGTTALVVLRLVVGALVVPVRVVGVIDEPDRYGWAYGTLPGHPERGEEGFLVRIADDGVVSATIAVDAVAADPIAKLGGPVTGALQRQALRRYLDALAP
jgi:uncharacterized protein (UPF0548 family)